MPTDPRSDSARWFEVRELFDSVVDLDEAERRQRLEQACSEDPALVAEVEALLAVDQDTGDDPVAAAVGEMAVAAAAASAPPPERIGPYRVLGELGRGGMGVVLSAERADGSYRQKVAIKLLARHVRGERAARQFRDERQILADLSHPSIARLLDGGSTEDGTAYLVMEHVDGLPIDQHCSRNRLDLRARLRLMLRVCDAVSHAHGQLVVHRDLKPSNILVTPDGRPKLLDFGIARLLTRHDGLAEATMDRALTPEYASPEQIEGMANSVAADVYSLGALLYRLLVGHSPFAHSSSSPSELLRAIAESEPRRPSDAVRDDPGEIPARQLRGDLDAIILCALRKEPERRYAGVEALAADLRAVLDERPISARPDSFAYRAGKLLRRQWPLAAALSLAILSLAGGLVARTVEARHAAREAAVAQGVSEFLVSLFRAATPEEHRGEQITARQLLERGVERIDGEFADQPLVRARLLDSMGEAYHGIGDPVAAGPLLSEALELRERYLGPDHLDTATSLIRRGIQLDQVRRSQEAEPYLRRGLAILEAQLPEDDPLVIDAVDVIGSNLISQVRLDEAEEFLLRARAFYDRHEGQYPEDSASNLVTLDFLYLEQGRPEKVIEYALRAVEATTAVRGADSPYTIDAHLNLAIAYQESGRLEEARELLERIVPAAERILGPDHDEMAFFLRCQGATWIELGRLDEAQAILRRSLVMHEEIFGPDHFLTDLVRLYQGWATLEQGDAATAEAMIAPTLASLEQGFGAEHYVLAEARHLLAKSYLGLGRPEAARELLELALPPRLRTYGEGSLRVRQSRALLAEAERQTRERS